MELRGVVFGRGDRQEKGESLATTTRFRARGRVTQDVVSLLPTGRDHGQHALREPAPVRAVGPAADPTPEHRVAQRTFHRVVRGLDTFYPRERPQTLPHLEDLEARRRRLRARAMRPFLKGSLDLPPQAAHPLLERPPLQSPVTHPVPVAKVGGVELEPRFEVTDPRFQYVDPLPHRQEDGGDGCLSVRRHLGPEFLGDG